MKFNQALLLFYDYFNQALISGVGSSLPAMDENHWETLYRNKLLYAWLDIWRRNNTLTPWAQTRLDIYQQKALIHEKLLEKLMKQSHSGELMPLKGKCLSAFYPEGFQRESRDIDILYKNESEFISAHHYLLSLGFREIFVWIRKTASGMAGSAKFRLKNYAGERALDDIYVEIHVNAFPVSNFSNLYFYQLSALKEESRLVVLLMAEFTFRDGVAKKFTLRDMMDVKLVFERIPEKEWAGLHEQLRQAKLEAPVLLLADFWQQEMPVSAPPLLTWLQQQCSVARWEGAYSIIENQSWPYQQQYGMSRQEFDQLVRLHRLLYDAPRQTTKTYSAEEMMFWLEKGLPVVAKYVPQSQGYSFQDNYQLCDRFIY